MTKLEIAFITIVFICNVVVMMVNIYLSKEISEMLSDLNKVWDDVKDTANAIRGL